MKKISDDDAGAGCFLIVLVMIISALLGFGIGLITLNFFQAIGVAIISGLVGGVFGVFLAYKIFSK